MLQSLTVGALSLTAAPYSVQTGYSFPVASLTDAGEAAQQAGAVPSPLHYADAPFTLHVIVQGATAAAISDNIDLLTDALRDAMSVTISEGDTARTAQLRSVSLSQVENMGGHSIATYTGTRKPAFLGEYSEHAFTITGGIGTAAVTGVPGDLAAETALDLVSGAATNLIGVGLWPEPAALYDPLDAASGSATTMTNANGIYPIGGTPPSIDVSANRGSHFVLAKVATNATAPGNTKLSVATANAGTSKSLPYVSAVAAGNVLLGKCRVPTADLPLINSFQPEASSNSYVSGTTLDTSSDLSRVRTITASVSGRLWKMDVQMKSASGSSLAFEVYSGSELIAGTGWHGLPAIDDWVTMYFENPNRDIYAGETVSIYIGVAVGSIQLYGSDSSMNANTRNYDLWVRARNSFPSANTISAKCTEAGKTATLYSVTRVPSDFGALVVPITPSAGTGISYVDGFVYPFDGTAVTGVGIAATFGDAEFAVPPGSSTIVVHSGSGTDSTGTLKVTSRHLGLS